MKTTLFALLLAFYSIPLSAQLWQPDFSTAQQVAAETEQNIVLVFSGSDWCAPCIKLDREIWEKEEFATAVENDFVFYRADFPRKKANRLSKEMSKKNETLAELYNLQGFFPLVVVLSPEGDLLGQVGYKKLSPIEYADVLKSFTE